MAKKAARCTMCKNIIIHLILKSKAKKSNRSHGHQQETNMDCYQLYLFGFIEQLENHNSSNKLPFFLQKCSKLLYFYFCVGLFN